MEQSKENLTKDQRKALKQKRKLEKMYESMRKENFSTDHEITVLCVRFGNKYGRDYVEKLRNMVARHLTVKYEFVCFTDDNHPIEGVRSIVMPNAGYSKGWWHKVHIFDPRLPLAGRILYFDLDVVIHNNIDKLAVMFKDDFVGILDFNRKFYSTWKYLNSSVMAWNHGTNSYIFDRFVSDPRTAMKMPGDQDWIWKNAREEIKFWPREWIQSYKWEIRKREDLFLTQGKRKFREVNDNVQIPPDCSVCVFHGDPNPEDVQDKFVVDNWR